MLSSIQQALIELQPADGVAYINQHPVRRDVSGAWYVGRNMVCDGVRRCTCLPDALAAVQPEKPVLQ